MSENTYSDKTKIGNWFENRQMDAGYPNLSKYEKQIQPAGYGSRNYGKIGEIL